jgi:hypothetical protein
MRWLLCLLISGCSIVTPGFDTRLPHEATNALDWDKEGNLTRLSKSTHDGVELVAGGDIVLDENGDIDREKSRLTYIYKYESKPETVGESYQHLSDRNAEVAQGFFQLVGTLAPYIESIVTELETTKRELATLKATTQPN